MPGTPRKHLPTEVWEILAASLVIAWRVGTYPAATLWRDWVVLVCGFWIFTVLAGRTRVWPAALGLMMAFLFVLYAVQQVPHCIAVLGSLR